MYDDTLKPHEDLEIRAFEEALFRSIDQASRGEFAAVHTPEIIMTRRRGRPVGSAKRPVTLRLDTVTLERLRASGKGWQTRASEALSRYARQEVVSLV